VSDLDLNHVGDADGEISMLTEARATIFVPGATGYIGGRLAPRLIERGYEVRCLARNRAKLLARPWAGNQHVEVVEGDASNGVGLVSLAIRLADSSRITISGRPK
jgi:nucleoside-diphosphate-sugar epimerase